MKAEENRSSEQVRNVYGKCSVLDRLVCKFSEKNLSQLSVKELTDANRHLEVDIAEMISFFDCLTDLVGNSFEPGVS